MMKIGSTCTKGFTDPKTAVEKWMQISDDLNLLGPSKNAIEWSTVRACY